MIHNGIEYGIMQSIADLYLILKKVLKLSNQEILEDLDKLEEAIRSRTLPETAGFFFGQDSYTWEGEQEDLKATDLKFVADAKKYLNEGYEVFYECWW